MEEVAEQELYVERIAALDLGKGVLEACVRLPHPARAGRRVQDEGSAPIRPPRPGCWNWRTGCAASRCPGW